MPLALVLLPLLPGLIANINDFITAIKNDPATPAEVKAQLDELSDRLDETAKAVADLVIRDV